VSQLHLLGCTVPVDAGGLPEGPAPLGESSLNIARDGRDSKRIILLLKPNALLLQLRGKRGAVRRCKSKNDYEPIAGVYASRRSGFSSFQTSIFSPLAIFSILSIETFRSHRSTELT
jgi:hypothetical protein